MWMWVYKRVLVLQVSAFKYNLVQTLQWLQSGYVLIPKKHLVRIQKTSWCVLKYPVLSRRLCRT